MITLIMGASYSGTSMIAKLCQLHGAWMGEVVEGEYSDKQQYELCENARWRQLCRHALGIEKPLGDQVVEPLFADFFVSLPKDESIVLKYPKAFFLLPLLKKIGIDFQILYVMRNIYNRAQSFMDREPTLDFTAALAEWNAAYLNLAHNTAGIDLYVVLYERFFKHPEYETRRVLEFVGLAPAFVDTSSIDAGKRHR